MAAKPDPELEALSKEYKKSVEEKNSDVRDDGRRSLRSGGSHPRVLPSPALHEQSKGNFAWLLTPKWLLLPPRSR